MNPYEWRRRADADCGRVVVRKAAPMIGVTVAAVVLGLLAWLWRVVRERGY